MAERTTPLNFRVEGFSLSVEEGNGKTRGAAEVHWDDDDGCFVIDTSMSGNYDFAPCDLEEIARILRAIPRAP